MPKPVDVTQYADIAAWAMILITVFVLILRAKRKRAIRVPSVTAASLKSRIIGSVIDGARCCLFVVAECLILYSANVAILRERLYDHPVHDGIAWACVGYFFFLLLPLSIAAYQNTNITQTFGNRYARIRVVGKDGTLPSWGRSMLRTILFVLSVTVVFGGFITVVFDRRRRAIHDLLTGTMVVQYPNGD